MSASFAVSFGLKRKQIPFVLYFGKGNGIVPVEAIGERAAIRDLAS